MEYKTKGVCSQKIKFEIKDGKVFNVNFVGGCDGNTKGVCQTGGWNGGSRSNQKIRRHPLWFPRYILPRSAGKRSESRH